MPEFILEYSGTCASRLKIDKSHGILHGVKILGTQSKNRRRYPVETLKKAIPLYENAKVNLDHPDGEPNKPRSYTDRLGVIRGVELRGEDGLYADFHFNPNHPLAEQLLWDAEHTPTNVGFSHNVEAVLRREGNETIVEDILAVRSVDLVADPATTSGLFESVENETASSDNVQTLSDELVNMRLENEALHRKIETLQILMEQTLIPLQENEFRLVSFFKTPFLESLYRCSSEEEVRRLIADRLHLVRQIKEYDLEKHVPVTSVTQVPFESNSGSPDDRRTFLKAITGR